MMPALEVHRSWMNASAPDVSDTWRWFHLERWSAVPSLASAPLPGRLQFEAGAPGGYASILQAAVWIVAESIRRDGVARHHLRPDDMRWARRLGLALMGDGPIAGAEAIAGAHSSESRDQHALDVVRRVVGLFPDSDQAVLRLALAAAPEGPLARGTSDSGFAPSTKTVMLVRLAKRHAAACVGVDLRQQSLPEIPSMVSSSMSVPDVGTRQQGMVELKHVG